MSLLTSHNPANTEKRVVTSGSTQYVLCNALVSNYIPPLINFTIEFTTIYNTSYGIYTIEYSNPGVSNEGWKVDAVGVNSIRFTTLGIQDYIFTDSRINTNIYQRYAITFNSSGATLFVNGVNISTIGGATPANSLTIPNYVKVGANELMRTADVRVWSTALSDATIATWAYKRVDNTHPNYANLGVYYKMDKQGVDGVKDEVSGNITTGILLRPVYNLFNALTTERKVIEMPTTSNKMIPLNGTTGRIDIPCTGVKAIGFWARVSCEFNPGGAKIILQANGGSPYWFSYGIAGTDKVRINTNASHFWSPLENEYKYQWVHLYAEFTTPLTSTLTLGHRYDTDAISLQMDVTSIRLYSAALTDTEITNLSNNTAIPDASKIIKHYNLSTIDNLVLNSCQITGRPSSTIYL